MDTQRKYDLALEEFLESPVYDAAEETLFAVAAKAFESGWLAAGGQPLSRPAQEDKYAFLRQMLENRK